MKEQMQALVDKLKSMTKEELNTYLEKCYQNNKENLDKILNADSKDYELPEGMHIVGFEKEE